MSDTTKKEEAVVPANKRWGVRDTAPQKTPFPEKELWHETRGRIKEEAVVPANRRWTMRNIWRELAYFVAENAALLHRADRAERILDKLRHPREAVLHATNAKFPFEASMIMAAVKAAEQEVDNDKHR